MEGYGGGGKRDWSVTIKRANIETVQVYHQIYIIYYTGLHLENYWKVKGVVWMGDWPITIKRQYRASTSIPPYIYHILYRVTFREVLEGNGGGGKGDLSVTIKKANIEGVLV